MGKRPWQVEKMKEEEDLFFKVNKNEFEARELLYNRKEIWDWVVLCVQGENKKLFCAHLVRECDKWDIHQLYIRLKNFLSTENYQVFGGRIEDFFTSKPRDNEDIFSYMSRLDKTQEEILHLQHLAVEAGETLEMPKFYKVWKILSAVEKFPDYRIFSEKVQLMSPQEWIKLTPEQIRVDLHKIHANKMQLQVSSSNNNTVGLSAQVKRPPPPPPQRPPSPSPKTRGGRGGGGERKQDRKRSDTPGRYSVQDKLKNFNCPEGVCLGFFRYGKCPRQSKGRVCLFKHDQQQQNTNQGSGGQGRVHARARM